MVTWSGRTSAFQHKGSDWETHDVSSVSEAFQTRKVLYGQWTKCPIEVEDDIKKLWKVCEYGNDNFYASVSIYDLLELHGNATIGEVYRDEKGNYQERQVAVSLENLIYFARLNGLQEDETFLIHWWW